MGGYAKVHFFLMWIKGGLPATAETPIFRIGHNPRFPHWVHPDKSRQHDHI